MSGIEPAYGDTSASKVLREGTAIVTFPRFVNTALVLQDFPGSSNERQRQKSKWQIVLSHEDQVTCLILVRYTAFLWP
jgi:hypothetical protein